ncbi:MAG: hypothetical protein ACOC6U_01095 [Thermoplasmatota archaeon]
MLSNKLKKQSIEDMNTKKLAERLKDLGEKSLHKVLLNEALNTAEQISSPENKTRVLAEMAVNLFNSGLEDLGKDIYHRILNSSEDIEKDSDRAKTLADLGRTFFDIDKKISEEFFERATGTAGEISDVEERIKSITHIAENKVKIDLIEEGVQLCEDVYEDALNLAEKEQNVLPLINIAEILAEAGHFNQSIDICKKARVLSKDISNENERCWALGSIGVVYAKSDKIENAVDTAKVICSEEEGNLPLGEIMISLAEADETEKALEFIDCVTNKELADSILSDIGCKLAKRGRIDEAEYVKELIDDHEEKEWINKEIAVFKASTGQFFEAIRIAETFIDIDLKILALTEIAKSLIIKGEESKLRETIEAIIELSEDSISDSVKVNTGEILADTGFLDLAVDKAREIKTSEEKAIALSYISSKSVGITVLSQDFLNTLDSIKDQDIEMNNGVKDDLKDIALNLTENKSRKKLVESIDSLHDSIDRMDI